MNDLHIFRNTFKDLFRIKKLLVVLLVAALPVLVGLLWRFAGAPGEFVKADVYDRLSETLIFGFVLVMMACVFGTNLVAAEVEQKTIVYLLTRPVPRWRIILMKYLAAVLATMIAVWISSALLLLVTGVPHANGADESHFSFGRDIAILTVGAFAYGGLFLLFATSFRRPLIIGLLYTFGIESWLPTLPGSFKALSLMAYLRALSAQAPAVPITSDSPFDPISHSLAWAVVIGVIVVTLILSCIVFTSSEYVPRDDV